MTPRQATRPVAEGDSPRQELAEGRAADRAATTIRDALRYASFELASIGSDEASLEAELLLASALGTDRTHLYQRLAEELPSAEQSAFARLLCRRLAHEPTAYVLGRKEFYGLEFEVTPAAIIPRPETELLVELAIEFLERRHAGGKVSIVDVGVGCGAIAVALATALPQAEVIAIDISPDALALARRNAERHGVPERIRFLEGDLLAPLEAPVDVIVANLPYVRTADFDSGPLEIREHEPRLGLDGGPDGLDVIRRLLEQAPTCVRPGGAVILEIGEGQGEAATALARSFFHDAQVEVGRDLAGLDRALVIAS